MPITIIDGQFPTLFQYNSGLLLKICPTEYFGIDPFKFQTNDITMLNIRICIQIKKNNLCILQMVTERIDVSMIRGIGFDATCSLVVLDKHFMPVSVSLTGSRLYLAECNS